MMSSRRFVQILPLLLCALARGSDAPASRWPQWDGKESVEQYARRANLPAAKLLDLGDGVTLELVLIPAGKFVMGTPEPEPVDEAKFLLQIVKGQALLALSGGVLLVLIVEVIAQAIRKRRRPNFSLAWLLAMTVAAGGALLSGMHWRHSVQTLETAQTEFVAAQARYAAASENEKPAHPVTLTQPFYMGKFAVTQEQYQQVMGTNPSFFKGKDHPVEVVSWEDAQEFCKRTAGVPPATLEAGGTPAVRTVRLPTEAEWEYACRAGTTSAYYSGDTDTDLDRVAWYGANSKKTTHPVGQKDANFFGLYDMHGNVCQWCQDWYEDDYYSKSPIEDPRGSAIIGARALINTRVVRGGSWYPHTHTGAWRSANRDMDGPNQRVDTVGFRVVLAP